MLGDERISQRRAQLSTGYRGYARRGRALGGVVSLPSPWFSGRFHRGVRVLRLSGYLITGLIVKEIERTGKLSFRNFYARRVRRLLPASGFVVVSTLLLGWFVYSPLELASYAKGGRTHRFTPVTLCSCATPQIILRVILR